MPFTLPPLSRRRFLGGSLATLGGVLSGGRSSAVEAGNSSWILFSDTHIAADRELVSRDVKMAANLEACVKQALAAHSKASGVFLSGDCALLDGRAEDYATLGGLLKPLREAGLPVHLMLGNHDDRENFLGSMNKPGAPSPVEHKVAGVVQTPLVNWFMLDSLDKTNRTPGLLGAEQQKWLEKSLDAHADKPAVIVVHHNIMPYAPGGELNAAFEKSLVDSPDLLKILGPRQHVKACFYGHTHNWSVMRESGGIHFVNLPPTAYVFKAGLPSGWVHASVEKDGMRLTLNCLDPAHTQHGAVVNLKWRA